MTDEPSTPGPVLSVVVACLDAEATLGVQLEALASQSCPVPWELLICDNGSRDGSVALARSYAGRIPGLRVIDASAVPGAGPARNAGVAAARGEWVAFCDADDEVAPDWLEAMCRALARHRFVAGRFDQYRLNGRRVLRSRPLQQQTELQSSDVGARLPHAGGGNLGIHRDDFLAVGGFDPAVRWLEDTDFSWRVQLAGVPLVFAPDVVVHVRLRSTFRTMYQQGYHYGAAHAVLEQRYGQPEAAPPSGGAAPSADAAPSGGVAPVAVRDRVSHTLDSLVDHVIGGKFFWRLGWSVGHRTHKAPPAASVAAVPRQMSRPAA